MTGQSIKACLAAAVLFLALAGVARAEPMASVGEVAVHDAWARASIGQIRTSAAYLTLEVPGERPDRLIAAASPIAETAGLHTHVMDGNVARMRPVAAIEITPGAPVVLEPGGLHIMLMGLKQPLVEGKTLPLSLTFERAGAVALEVPIKGMASSMSHGARPPAHEPATN
jgi:periplasmic copper chaperone A